MPARDLTNDHPDQAEHQGFPSSPVAWIPFLWRRVLFPGPSATLTPFSWRCLLLLLVLPSMLLYPCMAFPLFDPDEGRYAQIPREMLMRGEWVVPYLQAEPYLDKPPLVYWLIMLSYRVLGIADWSARLVPALAVHGTILVTFLLGRRNLGDPTAFWGAVLLGLAPAFMGMGRLLLLDGVFTFWATLGLFALVEALRGPRLAVGWWVLAAIACGLGVLTKGPVILILLIPPLWAFRLLTGVSWKLSRGALLSFTGILLAVVLPWYVAVCLRLPEFARYFLWEHNVLRFFAPFDHLEPVWFFIPIVLFGLLPGTFWLVPFLRFLFSGQIETARKRGPELGFLLLAGGWCVFFFSLSGSKLPTYVLPAFPSLSLALAYFLTAQKWHTRTCTGITAAVAFVLLGLVHYVAVPWFAGHRAPMGRAGAVLALCADPQVPVMCYPRNCDSLAFYLGRDDLRSYRSKHTHLLIQALRGQPRSVVLCTHRHTIQGLREALPKDLRIVREVNFDLQGKFVERFKGWLGETALGLCDLVVIEREVNVDNKP